MTKKTNIVIGVSLLLISMLLTISLPLKSKMEAVRNEKIINNYIETTSVKSNQINRGDNINYIALLEIPDIDLIKPLTKDKKLNDIKYNIQILTGNIPIETKDNLVLAAHSGNSEISFFKDLDELDYGSDIRIYHDGYKYVYRLFSKYEIEKTGVSNIIRDRERNTLTMITCNEENDNKQIIYIAYFDNKTTY
jgi:LPXTG-site transpeptidase (sortase) family protein